MMERGKRPATSFPIPCSKRRFLSSSSDPTPLQHCDALQIDQPSVTQPSTHPLSHNDYTIGWICALEVEFAAAEAMLDEIHPALLRVGNDPNVYNLGRIGLHNVAITCLPTGGLGTNGAATAAAHLLRSFPKLRFGLMVGIGGGVPSEPSSDPDDDIRLGDIVISKPTESSGGVIQYDFGKATMGDRLHRTGWLNAPPYELCTGVLKLQARHRREESLVSRFLEEMFDRYPKMAKTFRHQGVENDRLFESHYAHEGHNAHCDGCDPAQLVARQPRDSDHPVIHYGLIGSANQVVKNGATRERLRRELGILCVEMEAAGLMNNFPCLVVRGIADYSDSHKNNRWQPYAAATAAAYAKEVLTVIPAIDGESIMEATEPPELLRGELATLHRKLDSLREVTGSSSEVTSLLQQYSDESTSGLQRIERRLNHLVDHVKERCSALLPQQIEYNWTGGLSPADAPIVLLDASRSARTIYLPRIFFKTMEDFHDVLSILFRNLPGSAKVGRKEYQLETSRTKSVAGIDNWHQVMTPGAKVLMSMLFKRQTALQEHSCPRCCAIQDEILSQANWVTCYNCRLIFKLQETERIAQSSDREDISSPILETSSTLGVISTVTTAKTPEQDDEEAFSRIHYVHEKTVQPKMTSTPLLSASSAPSDTDIRNNASVTYNSTAIADQNQSLYPEYLYPQYNAQLAHLLDSVPPENAFAMPLAMESTSTAPNLSAKLGLGPPDNASVEGEMSARSFVCEFCEKAFARYADCKRHTAFVHKPVYQSCPVEGCLRKDGNGFSRRDHLIEHLRSDHHLDVPRRTITTPAGKARPAHLIEHLRSYHHLDVPRRRITTPAGKARPSHKTR